MNLSISSSYRGCCAAEVSETGKGGASFSPSSRSTGTGRPPANMVTRHPGVHSGCRGHLKQKKTELKSHSLQWHQSCYLGRELYALEERALECLATAWIPRNMFLWQSVWIRRWPRWRCCSRFLWWRRPRWSRRPCWGWWQLEESSLGGRLRCSRTRRRRKGQTNDAAIYKNDIRMRWDAFQKYYYEQVKPQPSREV